MKILDFENVIGGIDHERVASGSALFVRDLLGDTILVANRGPFTSQLSVDHRWYVVWVLIQNLAAKTAREYFDRIQNKSF